MKIYFGMVPQGNLMYVDQGDGPYCPLARIPGTPGLFPALYAGFKAASKAQNLLGEKIKSGSSRLYATSTGLVRVAT